MCEYEAVCPDRITGETCDTCGNGRYCPDYQPGTVCLSWGPKPKKVILEGHLVTTVPGCTKCEGAQTVDD